MIKLQDNDFIAEGTFQKYYNHHINKQLFIKVSKKNIKTSRLVYEIRYYEKII